ncbi:MAG: hypothetical protein IT184_14765 [Acidobacteria bacterium]|nr:hypothetical protein [Acidobacteriota bacterium]
MSVTNSTRHSIELIGIDGTSPLGFLAALGALVVVREEGEAAACLRWVRSRTWTPVLDGLMTFEKSAISELVAKSLRGKEIPPDAEEKRKSADGGYAGARTAVKKEMDKIKKEKLKGEDRRKAIEERVRPLQDVAEVRRREWLVALKDAVQRPELALGARIDCTAEEYRDHAKEFTDVTDSPSREAIRHLAAFGSDACLEDGKSDSQVQKIEATPFCFIRGSGNQNFLDTIRKLLTKVTTERVAQVLFEPWTYRDEKLSMRWDPGEDKRYALTDTKPADEGALTVWMANLLTYRSLALFSCAPTRRGLGTTGWAEIEEERVFTWPLWAFAASPDMARTLLQLRELRKAQLDHSAIAGRGIAAIYRARRVRFPATGASYKLNFSPARGLL